MTPIERAAAVYQTEPCARTFVRDLELHFLHGYVVSTPQLFMMGRPVCRCWPHARIVDPSFNIRARRNCWHVYLASGDLARMFDLMPFPLLFISFERMNALRIYRTDALRRRITKLSKSADGRKIGLLQGRGQPARSASASSRDHGCGEPGALAH